MPDESFENELLTGSLKRTRECPAIEALEQILERGKSWDTNPHLKECAYCKTEIALLQSFRDAEVPANDAKAVSQITAKLRERSGAVLVPSTSESWIGQVFGKGWLRPAALALAGALLVVAIGLQIRQSSTQGLNAGAGNGSGVFRSGTLTITAPSGDLQDLPEQFRWDAVTAATRYELHLMEVDHHELWNATSTQPVMNIPAEVRAQIVPLKTLLVQIDAFDATGRKVAQSEVVRFRLLQKIYSH
jgi:hypothetical protein